MSVPTGLRRAVALVAGLAVAALPAPGTAGAQVRAAPEAGGRTMSLGQPPLWRWQAGAGAGAWFEDPPTTAMVRAQAGVLRALLNPVTGLAELSLEGYVGTRGERAEAGARVMLQVPYLSTAAGVDYNARTNFADLLVTVHTPVRRGGLLARGTLVRIDWYPLSRHSFLIGMAVPLGDPRAGRSRPVRTSVAVSGRFDPPLSHETADAALLAALDSVRVSAEWIRRTVAPFLDHDARRTRIAVARTRCYLAEVRAHLAQRGAEAEVRHFHAELARAFTLAAGDEAAGRELARLARHVVLDEILMPYDGLLGRQRSRDGLGDLSIAARGRFARAAARPGLIAAERTEEVLWVFQRLTDIIEGVRRTAAREWDDPRLVWLPLQYGLLPEQHDEQAELDGLVERATGVAFTSRNRLSYVANLGFHAELLRMIRQTRDYHALWIHDFAAVTDGALDTSSFAQVVDGYLTALAERVETYDSTGTLPAYFIFLDQHYYEVRRSRILMSVLEDPLRAAADLPLATPAQAARLDSALQRLRRAVAGSRVLQAEAREYGAAWLRNRVKVHVNITNRPDASFWGGGLISSLFGYPDNIMRDHRKIAFRDVSNAAPFAGEAILTGMGVGQQYIDPSAWDDRSLVIEGPALLELRRAARELLTSQGMLAVDLPGPLRPAPFDAEGAVRAGAPADAIRFETRTMTLINGTGYLPKPINVAKAVLYSLMPAGSVFRIPDSLWNSTFFGALLVGAALRGGQALIVAPALANAPSAGFPQMVRAHELLTRLLLVRAELGDALTLAGGDIRIGLYALPPDTAGFASRAGSWARAVEATAFLRALPPFAPELVPVVAEVGAPREVAGAALPVTPRLHHKVQVVATQSFLAAVARSPEWPRLMALYLRHRLDTYRGHGDAARGRSVADSLGMAAARVFADARLAPGAATFALVGSQNQDYRGMFMDGEIMLLFTGAESLMPLVDLVFLEGTVTWVDDQATLDRLLPPVGELRRRLSRVAKDGV